MGYLALALFLSLPASAEFDIKVSSKNSIAEQVFLRDAIMRLKFTETGKALFPVFSSQGGDVTVGFCDESRFQGKLRRKLEQIQEHDLCPGKGVWAFARSLAAEEMEICLDRAWLSCPMESLLPTLAHEWFGHTQLAHEAYREGISTDVLKFSTPDEIYSHYVGISVETDLGRDFTLSRMSLYDSDRQTAYAAIGHYAHQLDLHELDDPLSSYRARLAALEAIEASQSKSLLRARARHDLAKRLYDLGIATPTLRFTLKSMREDYLDAHHDLATTRDSVDTLTLVVEAFEEDDTDGKWAQHLKAGGSSSFMKALKRRIDALAAVIDEKRRARGWSRRPAVQFAKWEPLLYLALQDIRRNPERWTDLRKQLQASE